jgi:hypothetical protein
VIELTHTRAFDDITKIQVGLGTDEIIDGDPRSVASR